MFVVSSTYLKPREEIDALLSAHAVWLKKQHDAGYFITSGSNVERTGDSILVQGITRESLESLLNQSPLVRAKAAQYDIMEITSAPEPSPEPA